jgi:hypothetical protein
MKLERLTFNAPRLKISLLHLRFNHHRRLNVARRKPESSTESIRRDTVPRLRRSKVGFLRSTKAILTVDLQLFSG